MEIEKKATMFLDEFKGDNYSFGIGKLHMVGNYAREFGKGSTAEDEAGEYAHASFSGSGR